MHAMRRTALRYIKPAGSMAQCRVCQLIYINDLVDLSCELPHPRQDAGEGSDEKIHKGAQWKRSRFFAF